MRVTVIKSAHNWCLVFSERTWAVLPRYSAFFIAAKDILGGVQNGSVEDGGATFAALERYFDGENERSNKLEKTTPQYTVTCGTAAMYVAEGMRVWSQLQCVAE